MNFPRLTLAESFACRNIGAHSSALERPCRVSRSVSEHAVRKTRKASINMGRGGRGRMLCFSERAWPHICRIREVIGKDTIF